MGHDEATTRGDAERDEAAHAVRSLPLRTSTVLGEVLFRTLAGAR
jgi:hypothetical protein